MALLGPKWMNNKLGFHPRDPHSEILAGILRRIPVLMSQMVGWRSIWSQKGVIWGPFGFRAQPAHLGGRAGGRQAVGGGWAVAPTLTPLVSTHPPKIAVPLLGGQWGAQGGCIGPKRTPILCYIAMLSPPAGG